MIPQKTEKLIKKAVKETLSAEVLAGCSMLVLQKGEEIFYHQDGFADLSEGVPLQRDTLFRLYSMTKPVTAAAAMILMERGQIDLFEPVSHFLPGFANQKVDVKGTLEPVKREVCIKDLLDMTSGLLYGGEGAACLGMESLFSDLENRLYSDNPLTTVEAADAMGRIPLAFQPAESWAYGTSADVLGAVIEIASDKRFGTFLREEIFSPLGMEDTGFFVPPEKQSRLSKVYESDEEGLKEYRGSHLGIRNAMDEDPAFESGGAGLASTIDDYAKFAGMLLRGGEYGGARLLQPRTVKFLTSGALDEYPQRSFRNWQVLRGYSYGNLMRVLKNPEKAGILSCPGEYGWDGWLGCHFANFPAEDLTLLFMLQKKGVGNKTLNRKVWNILLSELS